MLAKRLKQIAEMVSSPSIIDVGCDHALLDIYLTKKGITCTATDISSKVIEKAKANIAKENLTDKIKLICTPGLENVKININDTIVISGMGTSTILNILDIKIDNQLVISSNNDLYKLRKEIVAKGYYISDEKIVLEKKIYYVIIKFIKGHKKYTFKDLFLGPIAKKDKNYCQYIHNKYQNIYRQIKKGNLKKRLELLKILYITKK